MKDQNKTPVLKRLLPYAGNKAFMLYLAMFFSATSGILLLIPMVYIHSIVKSLIVLKDVNFELIRQNIFYAVLFPVLGMFLYLLALLLSHIFAFEVEKNIIKVNISKVMEKPMGYFANQESGRLRNIIVGGAADTHTILAHQLPDLASTIISPIVAIAMLFLFDWRLGVSCLLPIVIGGILMATMMTTSAKKDRDIYYENINNLSAETVEYVRGIPVVKTFGQSVESFRHLYDSIVTMKKSVIRMTLGYRNKMSIFEVISGAFAFFLVPIAISLILNGANAHVVVADAVIYLLIGPIFGVLIMRSAVMKNFLYFAQQALDKIEAAVDYPMMEYGNQSASKGGVEFKHVFFAYDDEMVLKDISFKVKKGETVALVGRSGGGKSTIAKLAARFYDVCEGEVLIDGINIKDYAKKDLMNKMAFVFQNSKLFKKSLRENLLIGNENASEEQIEAALKNAGADDIIERLDAGLDTIYGSKGTYFSGGEVQRLIIARAFLKDARYVVLDEATAFADPENEHIIQDSFKKLSKAKTTLMIAHRLSTVVNVDRILVIEDGAIVEEGKHQELLDKGGIYKKLWDEYQRSIDWKIGGQHD